MFSVRSLAIDPAQTTSVGQLAAIKVQQTSTGERCRHAGLRKAPRQAPASEDIAIQPAAPAGLEGDVLMACRVGMLDGAGTLAKARGVAALYRRLTGLDHNPALADPRLDSIRRLMVALRHGLSAAEAGGAAARANGVSDPLIDALRCKFDTGQE